jgi:hypothetical protein
MSPEQQVAAAALELEHATDQLRLVDHCGITTGTDRQRVKNAEQRLNAAQELVRRTTPRQRKARP